MKIFTFFCAVLFSVSALAAPKPNPAKILSTEMCNQIYSCDSSLDLALCISEAMSSDQLLDEFGGPETDGTGNPFSGIQIMLKRGVLHLNLSNLLSCIGSIQSLSCSSSNNIRYSWDSADPTNFGNLEELPDGLRDCATVFYL